VTDTRHLIGLLLGTEEDWPSAFEQILHRLGPVTGAGGTRHAFDCERITIGPSTCVTGRATTWSSTGWRTGTTTRESG
jgi:hypothetical protein